MTLFVDADCCSRAARELVIRAARRLGARAVFAANRRLPDIPQDTDIRVALCPAGKNAADDYIARSAGPGDLAVTRDLDLAARLIDRSVSVLDDRGRLLTRDAIGHYRSLRDFATRLEESSLLPKRRQTYNAQKRQQFARALDTELRRLSGT